MRGSPSWLVPSAWPAGIIPAHAGLTQRYRRSGEYSGDHPRACGAHPIGTRLPSHLKGSSPRMRGSPNRNSSTKSSKGIIPAHAGLTCDHSICYPFPKDHLRACGAHPLVSPLISTFSGSSPRMRGSQMISLFLCWLLGIIPAHAGLTQGRRSSY